MNAQNIKVTPSYLLKVTKFFIKISQFEFIVMTEKNIFVYKLFLLSNISDLSLFFFCKNCNLPLKKVTSLFSSNPPLKVEVLSRPPFLKIWDKVHPLPPQQKGGAHYDMSLSNKCYTTSFFYYPLVLEANVRIILF